MLQRQEELLHQSGSPLQFPGLLVDHMCGAQAVHEGQKPQRARAFQGHDKALQPQSHWEKGFC